MKKKTQGIIVCGYQGVGKSSYCCPETGCIDLESSCFWYGDTRVYEWYKYYANIAMHLSNQGFIVFTASHAVFRMHLHNIGCDFITLSPSLNLKDDWIKKLEERYYRTYELKDYKAWKCAVEKFDDNITNLQREPKHIIIDNIDYKFSDLVTEIKNIINKE